MTASVVVLGAGPTGATAAIRLARAGARVLLIDDGTAPGGRIWQAGRGALARGPGARLRRRIAALSDRIDWWGGAELVGLSDERIVEVLVGERLHRIAADIVILAAGAHEIAMPVEGWTLPGVIAAGALQTMLKRDGMVPRGPIVLAGAGPLLMVVAADLAKAGGEVSAVVDAAPFPSLPTLARMGSEPSLLVRALRLELALKRAGTRVLRGHALRRIEGKDGAEAVVAGPVDANWTRAPGPEIRIEAGTVGLSFGLSPSIEALAAAGARLVHVPALGGFVPERQYGGETTIMGLFAIGDGAGVRGAETAVLEAEIAAAVVAERMKLAGVASLRKRARKAALRLSRIAVARDAVGRWWQVRPGILADLPDETILCRCEEVTKGEISEALEHGFAAPAALKLATRAGMGSCQGRCCRAAVEALTGLVQGPGSALRPPSLRPPLRPVPVAAWLSPDETGGANSLAPAGEETE